MPANIQQEVDMETAAWGMQWGVAGEVDQPPWPRDMEHLPPIAVQEVKEAAAQFKEGSGLGWDRMHPRALLRLPDWLLQELCNVMQ